MKNKRDILKRMAKVNRERRLEEERQTGRVRASSWGGKPSHRQNRQSWRQRNR